MIASGPRILLRRGRSYARIVDAGPTRTVVGELERIGFELIFPDAMEPLASRWRLRFGDILPEQPEGRLYRSAVAWAEEPWFDRCRGPVEVKVERTDDAEDARWAVVLRATVHVVPSKFGEDSWQAMRADLVGIAADLASDLLGRASHGRRPGAGARGTMDELRAAGRALPRLRMALSAIAEQPHTILSRPRSAALVSPRSLDARTLAHMARAGQDPRCRQAFSKPLRVPDRKPQLSLDVPEHRTLAACLEAIVAAMSTCAAKARAEAAALEEDRPWRDIAVGTGRGTLYELYDLPRIERLRSAESDAEALAGCARALREAPPLAGVRAQGSVERTAVFANVPAYSAAYRAMSYWQAEGGLAMDEGTEARRKDTARMYEQWMFLQIAAALGQAGLVVEDAGDFLRRIGSRRLVADLHRGATLRFRHTPSGRVVSIAYEPWVRPKAAALAAEDAFYKGRTGEAAWSPDVLLAVHAGEETSRPEAAFVLDAKYSRRLSEQQWDETSKYLAIRRTADDAPAVRQVWLICPGVEGIGLRDDAVAWTEQGPDRPPSEFLQGYARMAPNPSKPVGAPVPEAVALVVGLLRHIGLTLSLPELDV